MMQRIDLAPLLRETVATPYSDMVTRSTGAALRDRIEQTISGASHRTTQLDFTAVGLIDFSCADEVVAKLVRMAKERLGRIVALRGLDEHLWESIHAVLEHQQLAVAVLSDGTITLLGSVPADVHHLFERLEASTPLPTSALSQRLGWADDRTAEALDAALSLGVCRCAGGGYVRLPLA